MTTTSATPYTHHRPVSLTTGTDRYRATVATYGVTPATEEERQGYAVQAKQGDQEARQLVILVMYPLVAALAQRYHLAYVWASGARLDYEDLAQVGMMTIVERLDAALEAEAPYGYLTVAARKSMAHYCIETASLIRTPRRGSVKEAHRPFTDVESIDRVIDAESGLTLGETLVDLPQQTPTRDYTPLYEAVQALPERHREVVTRHYGLFDYAPEPLRSIERDKGFRAKAYKTVAVQKLATALQGVTV